MQCLLIQLIRLSSLYYASHDTASQCCTSCLWIHPKHREREQRNPFHEPVAHCQTLPTNDDDKFGAVMTLVEQRRNITRAATTKLGATLSPRIASLEGSSLTPEVWMSGCRLLPFHSWGYSPNQHYLSTRFHLQSITPSTCFSLFRGGEYSSTFCEQDYFIIIFLVAD